MTALDFVRDVLHQITGLLVWPVLLCLVVLAALTIIAVGTFAREAYERRRGLFRKQSLAIQRLDKAASQTGIANPDLQLERTLQEIEHQRWKALHRGRLPIRLGPSLGLMGTLIPMASALAGLASGNLPSLASNMVTAFAATVLGLAISVTSYLISSFREEWVRHDLREASFHAESLVQKPAISREQQLAVR